MTGEEPALQAPQAAETQSPKSRAPLKPYLVLLIAMLLPGFGYVLNGQARRGLIMQFCMIVFAVITWNLAPEQATLIGKLAGGIFIYAVSLPDTYRMAKLRWLTYQQTAAPAADQT